MARSPERLSESGHTPVMVASVLEALDPRPDARLIDATTGLGGHSEALLERLGARPRMAELLASLAP